MIYRHAGFTLLELMIALGIVAIVSTIGVVYYVNYTTSAGTADVLMKISVIREQIEARHKMNQNVLAVCDDSMFSAGDLDDPYMDIAIAPIPLDENDLSKGYGAGIVVLAQSDREGPEGVRVAQALHDSLAARNARLSGQSLTSSVVSFSVLLSNPDEVVCEPVSPSQLATTVSGPSSGGAGAATTAAVQQPASSTTGVQAITPPATFSAVDAAAASDIVNAGMYDPVFASAVANALAAARLSGDPVSLPGSPEAAATLAKCNISVPTPCKDNYTGDCAVDFPGMCTDPVRACAAARICPQS
ncbi:MAG: prepilin-type N-terminal cleavage/methylation domain-containing protein [Proteobacteria bacterium]|nr:prepilin-type N-terminal cleavage/methylation domain-containing protein [Pseudomonadota bacterium]